MAPGDPIVVRLEVNWWMRRPLVSDQNWGDSDGRYWNTQSVSRRSFHSGGRLRVLHRPRSRRARGDRPRTCASCVAGCGRDHNGRRNMVDALRRHARLHHAHTDVLRHRIDQPFAGGGIFVTGSGFYVLGRQSASMLRLVLSGIFMGLGIAAMHYTGMAAMRGHAELSYDPLFVTLSLVIAIGASTVALWLAFRTTDLGQKLVAAGVMGLAISGMHYTAMSAGIFITPGPVSGTQVKASLGQNKLELAG